MYTLSDGEIRYSEGTGAKGPWKKAQFTLTDGKEVIMWGSHSEFSKLAEGVSVSGDLTRGEYKGKEQWTIKDVNKPYSGGTKKSDINKAMDKKAAGIEKSMDRKEEGIKNSAVFRDATLLTCAWVSRQNIPVPNQATIGSNHGTSSALLPKLSAKEIQDQWMMFRDWLKNEYADEQQPF